MKKLFAIMLILGATVFTAQAQKSQEYYRELDRVVIRNGKPVLMHGDNVRPHYEGVTTEDGAKVTIDGVYIAPDGTTTKLQEGDIVYITGKRGKEKAATTDSKK